MEKKITLDAILHNETSFPLTIPELRHYMKKITHDAENLDFIFDLIQAIERVRHYAWISALDVKVNQKGLMFYEGVIIGNPDELSREVGSRCRSFNVSASNLLIIDAEIFNNYAKKEIYELLKVYLTPDSPKEINVSASAKRHALESNSLDPSIVFEECFKEVYSNIDANAVPRFIKYASRSNIGESEAKMRIHWTFRLVIMLIISNFLLMFFKVNNFFRILTIPFCFLTFSSYWQWKARFCVILGRSKLVMLGSEEGKERQVLEACVLKSHAMRTREVYIKTFLCTFITMAAIVLLPPWNFLHIK